MDDYKEQNSAPKKPEKVVEVQEQLAKMQELIDKQAEQIGILTHVADKGRLARLKNPKEQPMVVKLNLFDGKVIKKWQLVEDYVKKGTKENVERQVVEYTMDDDSVVQMPYIDSVLKTLKVSVEVIEMSEKRVDGVKCTFFTVEYDGKTYKVDSKFIN